MQICQCFLSNTFAKRKSFSHIEHFFFTSWALDVVEEEEEEKEGVAADRCQAPSFEIIRWIFSSDICGGKSARFQMDAGSFPLWSWWWQEDRNV